MRNKKLTKKLKIVLAICTKMRYYLDAGCENKQRIRFRKRARNMTRKANFPVRQTLDKRSSVSRPAENDQFYQILNK